MKTKSVDWAYPTSPNAAKFGCKDKGCWVVSIAEGTTPPEAVESFPNLEAALTKARSLDLPWNAAFIQTNPNFVASERK